MRFRAVLVGMVLLGIFVTPSSAQANDSASSLNQNAKYVVFDAPNAVNTYVVGINDRGQVAGAADYTGTSASDSGFVRDENGNLSIFDAPGAISTYPTGINNEGDVVGTMTDSTNNTHAFIRSFWGVMTIFDPPNGHFQGPARLMMLELLLEPSMTLV